MVYLGALVLFFVVTVVTWYVAVALYQQLTGGPDLRHNPNYPLTSAISVLMVTLFSFFPFPAGYLLALVIWGLAAKGMLELSWGRAMILFLLLAALSMVSRLTLLGILNY